MTDVKKKPTPGFHLTESQKKDLESGAGGWKVVDSTGGNMFWVGLTWEKSYESMSACHEYIIDSLIEPEDDDIAGYDLLVVAVRPITEEQDDE